MSGIYIHIPFCKQACSYCNFYFTTRLKQGSGGQARQSGKDRFVEKLIDEIRSYKGTEFTKEPVQTIYFGGGTPSLLKPGQVKDVLKTLDEVFELQPREVTFEINPDDVTAEYLAAIKCAGISRASMGIQSFQPELLKFMNRAHTRDEALKSLELLKKAGFQSFTVDLIYGNPNQTAEQLLADIELLMEFEPPHVSAYSLTVEPNTRLGKQVELNRVIPATDDEVARQFKVLNKQFKKHGIERYEVSNYSRRGSEALHNSSYWNHQNYLGLGPAAHSFWWSPAPECFRDSVAKRTPEREATTAGKKKPRRWQNEADIKNYPAQTEPEYLTMQQVAEERIMMGLRTREGVARRELNEQYNYKLNDRQLDYLNKKEEEGKLTFNESIRLTDAGIIIADAIILDLVTLY